jgi:poly-beta-1,6-N-acetyl-D-glucosamine N-deacetylase
MHRVLAALIALAAAPAAAEPRADHAVVLLYHRFGEAEHAATNIGIAQFRAHIDHLAAEGFRILPLPEIVERVREGHPLPDRAVAITVDDAFLSAYTEAAPILAAAGLPWTLFVATELIDRGGPDYMGWAEVRALAAAGVDIGSHTASHRRLAVGSVAAARREIERSDARFAEELGLRPTLFAYPYGEASRGVRDVMEASGFRAAFGHHSGVVHGTADPYFWPRFTLNEQYGDPDRFRTVASALPLPVADLSPTDMLIPAEHNPPAFGFTVLDPAPDLDRIACYAGDRLHVERLGDVRVEVRFDQVLAPGPHRVNCTLPGPGGRWRWLGTQLIVVR